MTTQSPALHVVLGAGQVGPLLANELLQAGYRVRLVSRSGASLQRERLEVMQGELTDIAFTTEACRGAEVVYHCANPAQYHRWESLLFPLSRGILEGAKRAKARRLVVLDNLYMVGKPSSSPFNEDAGMRPCSKKGELRKQLVNEFFSAHARGDIEVTSGRASDFFGPGATGMSAFGDHLGSRLAKKKPVEVFGNPDLPRSYSYIPDVAKGLAVLGANDKSIGKVWHLPVAWSGTTRELLVAIGKELGREVKLRPVPDFLLALIGLFSPMMGAIREMTYQWKMPYVVDDRRFIETFGVHATPSQEAITATAQYLRQKYAL